MGKLLPGAVGKKRHIAQKRRAKNRANPQKILRHGDTAQGKQVLPGERGSAKERAALGAAKRVGMSRSAKKRKGRRPAPPLPRFLKSDFYLNSDRMVCGD
jgi:hypothetical protein